ncbi:MAG: ATP-binding protein [bacterium]
MDEGSAARYAQLLEAFCKGSSPAVLEQVTALSADLVRAAIPSQDIMALHSKLAETMHLHEDPVAHIASEHFLLEVMIAYGVAYSILAERLLVEAGARAEIEHGRSDDADRAQQERLDLLAGVSHELGGPLTVVKGNVHAIRRFLEAKQSWPDELTEREEDIQFAVDRMLALREDLSAASRNEHRSLELVPVHLGHCLHRVVRWARATATTKRISMTEENAATCPLVLGDESSMQSIFSNLLSNAVRYTLEGGSVTVRTSNLEGGYCVEVTDTGIGISPDDQPRIFERFYRTREAEREVAFGLGLGLAITRDLVTAMAGTITVSSVPGSGSTFTVMFPCVDLSCGE